MRREILSLSLLILIILFPMCIEKEVKESGIKIVDSLGREVYLKKVPVDRIVITFNVEELIAVGGEEALKKMIGWSRYYWEGRRPTVWKVYTEKYPWLKGIEDVGYPWKGDFNAEKVIKLKPDVVIMSKEQYKYVKEDIKRLEDAGIPVIFIDYYEPFNITMHEKSTYILGKILGREDRARKIMEYYKSKVSEILNKLKEVKEKPNVLLMGKGYISYGKNHYRGKMIEIAGGNNVAAKVLEMSGELNPEFIIKENPDIIIFIGKVGWNVDLGYNIDRNISKRDLEELISKKPWNMLKAIKEKRVCAIHIYFVHGHIFDYIALEYFVKWFHPKIFGDINPENDWKEFHEKFLPVNYSGTWAICME